MRTNQNRRNRQRRGNYSILMGATAIAVIGFAAFAVDISLITMAELQAQAAADAASHAALIAFRQNLNVSEGNLAASFMVDKNPVAMGTATIDSIEYGQWDFSVDTFTPNPSLIGNANAVRVNVSRQGSNTVDLLLAPLLGILNHDVDGRSVTSQQQRALMLIQDMSCSMMSQEYLPRPNDTDVAVEQSRVANRVFLDFLIARPQSGDMLGLAMFSQVAASPPVGPHPWGNRGMEPWLPLTLIEGNEARIEEGINGICDTQISGPIDLPPISSPHGDKCLITGAPSPHCFEMPIDQFLPPDRLIHNPNYCKHPISDIGSTTNPEPAILQAINELNTSADDGFFRGILLMSDGVPNSDAGGFTSNTEAINRAKAAANLADANGISIWTVLFTNGSFDPAFMGCDPTDADGDGQQDDPGLTRGIGFCQSSPNPADLPEMYRKVAESLPTAFVQ